MLTIGNMRYLLKQSNVRTVSDDTGLSYNTLINIANGTNINPTYKVIKVLTSYFSTEATK